MHTFPAWRPDAYSLSTGFSAEISGVLAGTGGYIPLPSLAAIGAALAAVCRGAIAVRLNDGSVVVYAGTATNLYRRASATVWTDVTRASAVAYAVPADGFWSFEVFDANVGGTATSVIIATNGVDAVQFIDVNSGTTFEPLSGSAGASGTPPIGRYVKAVGDFLWLMDLPAGTPVGPTGVASSGRRQLQWSGFRDFNHWTINDKSCDFATFPYGGFLMGCSSQLGGLVFLQKAIWRFVRHYDKIFDFAPFQEDQGTDSPYSIISHEAETYFYGTDGFMAIGPDGIRAIGNQWVDTWFGADCNQSRLNVICGTLDPVNMRVFWLYPSNANSTTILDKIIVHDILNPEKPWVHADVSASYIFPGSTPGATLADLTTLYTTLSGVPYPLGSRVWLGGVPGLAAFGSDQKLAFFSGSPLAAALQTAQFQPIPGSRSYVNGFRIVGDASNATGRIATAERPQDDVTWTAAADLTAQGLVPQQASTKYVTAEVDIAAGELWTYAAGIDFMDDDLAPDGVR